MVKVIRGYVGLDVHKESIAVAVGEATGGAARFVGTISHDVPQLLKVLGRLGQQGDLAVVYEAGPTGYGLQGALVAAGEACQVIAPSLIPRRPGNRAKTDRRDCVRLAELARAGELKPIWVPLPEDESIRDLARARADAVNARTHVRHPLKGYLLRHGLRYASKTAWSKGFHRWLGTPSFDGSPAQIAFAEYQLTVQAAEERVARLTEALVCSIEGGRFAPVVVAFRALRGIGTVSAAGLVVEIGDIEVFFLPGYSPEPNSDERLNADLKHAIGSKVPVRTKAKMRAAADERMQFIVASRDRVRSDFQDPIVKYAA